MIFLLLESYRSGWVTALKLTSVTLSKRQLIMVDVGAQHDNVD